MSLSLGDRRMGKVERVTRKISPCRIDESQEKISFRSILINLGLLTFVPFIFFFNFNISL